MDFDDAARLDTSRVSDVRGRGGFGGGRGAAIGGGGLGIVGLLVALLLGINPADLGGGGGSTVPLGGGSFGSTGTATTQDLAAQCQTGADADRDETCRFVALENSLSEYWTGAVPGLRPPRTTLFGQGVNTGCGQAHEYGHHVQNLTGANERAQQLAQEGEQSGSVRLELQADCYAGVWAENAAQQGLITFDDTDVTEGLSAAAAVGDDRIQERSAGRVDPESWTHGSAEQRQRWFRTGLASGDPRQCDTFGVPEV